MSRPSHSRQSSFSYIENSSRRSSVSSNPNVFSDDYALEPIDSRLDLNLQDLTPTDETITDHDRTRHTLTITPYPAIPARLSLLNRTNSTSKRPSANDAASVSHDGATQRTLSTSSRFSFVRSQSPYSGPTQPSHPYAMYPQITRASSIASQSTVRQPENPFIPIGGPEHPYSLYPQNVPEDNDDDDDIGSQPIPLGFPRLGLGSQQASSGTSRSDVGDIIGSDGHIEQLPPYTRYADNVVAKGDMADISDSSTLRTNRRPSQRSTLVATESRSSTVLAADSDEREILLNEEARKEGWKDKAQKKVCGGLALWLVIAIVAMIVLAGVLGGVIGGYVGRNQSDASATATVLMDADPTYTNKDTPACPTGRYTIPFKQTQEINSCIAGNMYFGRPWGCLDFSFLGITISDSIVNGSKTLQVKFEDYSVNTSSFLYGPQPPDFNGSTFDLTPSNDRDRKELGVAMFFYKTFDKLSILPQFAIRPHRRSIDERELFERGVGGPRDGDPLMKGDAPWFCFWNSTVNEFWIYLQQPAAPADWNTSFASSPTPTPSPTDQSSASGTIASATSSSKWTNYNIPTPHVQKRDVYLTPYYPQYPQLVKMVTKRKATGNVQPYCQQMYVMDDWSIVPNVNNGIVFIQELEYDSKPIAAGTPSRRRSTVTQEYQSNCVCEWMST